MAEHTILTPAEPKRDRWGRPLIPPRDGGKAKAYTRPTTIAALLDDRHNLELWMQRQVLLGTIARPDLHALAATTDPDDRAQLNRLCANLRNAAASDAKANMGTAIHAAVEASNRGVAWPAMFDEHVANYRRLLDEIGAEVDDEHVEQFVVNDDAGAAGTFDMRLRIDGTWYVADLKTGSTIEWSARAFAVQLAIYQAHTSTFDWSTMTHGDRLDLAKDRGVIIHLPANGDEASAHWIDLDAGRAALAHALWVKGWRKRKDIVAPLGAIKIDGADPNNPAAVGVVGGLVERPSGRPRRNLVPTPQIAELPEDQRPPKPTSGAAPEGRDMTDEEYERLRQTLRELGDVKAQVTRWRDQAMASIDGRPAPAWDIGKTGRTHRRYALAMAACALADFADADDEATVDDIARQVLELVIGDDVQTHPVGHLIGVLTVDEAREVWKRVHELTIRFNEDDRPRVVAA